MENRDSTKLRKRGSNYAGQDSSVREGEREEEGREGIISATATIYVFLEPVTRVCKGESMGIT